MSNEAGWLADRLKGRQGTVKTEAAPENVEQKGKASFFHFFATVNMFPPSSYNLLLLVVGWWYVPA